MKVLFLDIDGVLNSSRTLLAYGSYPHGLDREQMQRFDAVAIKLVQRLCRLTQAKVVVSSSWRLGRKFEDFLVFGLPIYGRTPIYTEDHRGKEIAAWLSEHPEVSRYAIVDDSKSEILPEQKDWFVQTDPQNGFMYEHYWRLYDLLTEEDDKDSEFAEQAGC